MNDEQNWKPKFNPWSIAIVVALAAFMEVLDTSIANVALPHIAGGLGASQDQSTWILTSYLVANAIVLPTTGWITTVIGRKKFLLICIALFTATSFVCGIAPSMPILLLARILQGIAGGGMQPMAQAIMADSFPPEKRGQAFALFGITAVVAPAIGPTLGGWITDNASWRWIFFINLPIGLITLFLINHMVEDPPFLRRKKPGEVHFDSFGFGALAIGIGCLQVALDKGQEDGWFSSSFILILSIVAIVCISFMLIWEWYEPEAIVDVRLFRSLNFAGSSAVMFVMGAVSFATTVLMSQYLQNLMGYTAQKAGLVLSAAAVVLLIEMPIVGQLTSRVQARYLIAFGWFLLGVAMLVSEHAMSLQISFKEAMWLSMLQYAPVGFIFVPTSTAAYNGIAQNKSDSVSGLINFMRNLGSGVGTAALSTILAQRAQFHQSRLIHNTRAGSLNFMQSLAASARQQSNSAGSSMADGIQRALANFYRTLQSQASALSYLDVFAVVFILAVVMFVLSFFLEANDPGQGAPVAA